MNVEKSLKYPLNDDEWKRTMGIGTVLELLTFLVLPQIVVQGYVVRAMRRTIRGDDEPPAFDDWGGLLVDGFKLTFVFLVYNLVPTLVFVVMAGGAVMTLLGGELTAGLLALLGAAVVPLVLFVLFNYAAGAAAASFAATGSMAAAFGPDVVSVMASPEYVKAWGAVLVIGFAVGALKLVVGVIPVVHFLLVVLVPFLVKYVNVVYAHLWAQAYVDAVDARAEPATVAAPA